MNTMIPSGTVILFPSRLWIGLAVWLALAVTVAASDLASDPQSAPLLLGAGVALPPLFGYLIWRSLPTVRQWVSNLELQTLISLHAIRTVGLGFIFLSLHGHLHPTFAWLAGLGDAVAAIGALAITIKLGQGQQVSTTQIRNWNRFGMLDFVIAVGAGLLLRSSLLGSPVANTDLMGSIPLALFPLFAVPLMFLVHLAIAVKLSEADRN